MALIAGETSAPRLSGERAEMIESTARTNITTPKIFATLLLKCKSPRIPAKSITTPRRAERIAERLKARSDSRRVRGEAMPQTI